jgi:putative membrane protein
MRNPAARLVSLLTGTRALVVVLGGVLAAMGTQAAALAHGSAGLTPEQLPSQWTLEAQVIIPIALLAWFYGAGVRSVWQHAGVGHGVRVWQAAAFGAGVLTLVIALVSPLDAASSAVFSAHMVQHALLMLVAAPLLVLGEPGVAFTWATPRDVVARLHSVQRNRIWSWIAGTLMHPAVVWTLFAVVFWVWHVPALYDAGVRHDGLHALEHVTLLAVSVLFWWMILHTAGHRRFEFGAAVVFVFTSMLQMMIVPALLIFSGRSWYPYYAHINPAWHLSPLADQSLAGLIMWMSSNVLFLIVTGYLVARWLQEDERRVTEDARYREMAFRAANAGQRQEAEEAAPWAAR